MYVYCVIVCTVYYSLYGTVLYTLYHILYTNTHILTIFVHLSGFLGRGRFYLEAKTTGAGAILLLKGRKPTYIEWLNKYHINEFLRKIQKTSRFRELILEKVSMIYGLLMVEEEEKNNCNNIIQSNNNYIESLLKHIELLQTSLANEEEAKRRMLLRYIHIAKDNALLSYTIQQNTTTYMTNTHKNTSTSVPGATGSGAVPGSAVPVSIDYYRQGGILQLPDSNITDEEMHALSALLRNDTSITELYLRNNFITDDGARALGMYMYAVCLCYVCLLTV